MKKFVIAAAAAATLIAVPASAEVFIGADRSGAGVQVGPVGVGVGPRFGWDDGYRHRRHYDGYYAYGAADCRVIRERIETPSGRTIIKSRRVCD